MKTRLQIGSSIYTSILVFSLLSFPAIGQAAIEILVMVDADKNSTTGCTVSTIDGDFNGAELLSVTTISTDVVTDISYSLCNSSNTFDAPVSISSGGWPIGLNSGFNGADLVETFIPLNLLPSNSDASYRLGFSVQNSGGPSVDALLSSNGGDPILPDPDDPGAGTKPAKPIPMLSDVGFFLLITLLAAAASHTLKKRPDLFMVFVISISIGGLAVSKNGIAFNILDGKITQWGATPDATDPEEGGIPDITAVFLAVFGSDLRIRIDGNFHEAAPQVESTIPIDNAAGVSLSSNLQITFNEPVNTSDDWITINCSNSGSYDPSGTGTKLNISGGPTVFTVDPASDFALGDVCNVTIEDTLVSDQDSIDPPDHLSADFLFTFYTGDGPPQVDNVSPADGAANVPLSSNLQITFNEPVNTSGDWVTISCSNSGSYDPGGVGTLLNISGGPTVFTVDPAADFSLNDVCTVTIDDLLVSDQDGIDPPDHLPADFQFSFSTEDGPPQVDNVSPADGAANVPLSSNLQITFNEPVNTSGNWITVNCSNSGSYDPSGTGTKLNISGGPTVFTVDPAADFSLNDVCTVTIDDLLVADQDGIDPPDHLPADFQFSFSVADGPPQVVSVSPANGESNVAFDSNLTITFNEPVTGNGAWAQIVCGLQTQTVGVDIVVTDNDPVFILDPAVDFPAGESCTLTVFSNVVNGISDDDPSDPPNLLDGDGNGTEGPDFTSTFSTLDQQPALNTAEAEQANIFVAIPGTFPGNGLNNVDVDSNLRLTFSEAVNVSGTWFNIVCSSSGTRNPGDTAVTDSDPVYIIDPNVDFSPGETCRLTLFAAQIDDDDAADPPANPAADISFDFEISPVAVDDNFTATTHLEISINAAGGVLFNDSITGTISGFGDTLGNANGTVANGSNAVTTTNGGTVILSADGSFTYNPPAAFTGMDSFYYALATPNGGSDTAKVDITVSGPVVWYIDSNAASPGDGTARKPFQALSGGGNDFAGNAADAAGHYIFIDNGGSAYTCGITLLNDQTLIGDGDASTIEAIASFTKDVNTSPGLPPTPSGTDPTLTSASTHCITLALGNTIRGLTIGNTPLGFGVRGAAVGTFNIIDTSINGTGGALEITTSGTVGTVTFNELSSINSTARAIALNNVGGNTITVVSGSISAPANTAIDITNGSPKINYPGSIAKNNAGRLFNITSTNGASLTFSGSLSHSNAGATGILVSSNTGTGSISFSGTTKTLNTGSNTAINLNANTTSTINLSGGGLDIDTTSGVGLTATAGGTVNVTGTGSSINTTTGVGVNIVNTTIGSGGVSFQSVSVNGATNGIVLNNTGTSGGFTITGDGSNSRNASGGSIQNTTSHGIVLTNTQNFSASSVDLVSPGDAPGEHGISATALRGSANLLRGARISGISQAGSDGVRLVNNNTNLGKFEVNDSLFTGVNNGGNDGIFVNGQGNSVMAVDIIGSNFDSLRGDGVQVNSDGSSQMTVNINTSNFTTTQNFAGNTDNSRLTLLTSGTSSLTATVEDNFFEDTGTQPPLVPVSSSIGVFDVVSNDTSSFTGRVTGNTIDEINLEQAVRIVGDDNASEIDLIFGGAAVADRNTIDDVQNQDAIFLYLRDATQLGNISILNNHIGNTTAIAEHGIEFRVQSRNTVNGGGTNPNSPIVVNALIDDNIIKNSDDISEAIDLESESDSGDGSSSAPAATLNVTVEGNTLQNQSTGNEAEIDSEDGPAGGASYSQICLDMSSNTLDSNNGRIDDLDEDSGAILNVVQGSPGAAGGIDAANSIPAGNVDVQGSPNFGAVASCTLPTH